jgi:hypothetical protein
MARRQLHQRLSDHHSGTIGRHRVLDAAAARVDQRVGLGRLEDVLVLSGDPGVEVDQQLRRAVGLGVVAEQPLAQPQPAVVDQRQGVDHHVPHTLGYAMSSLRSNNSRSACRMGRMRRCVIASALPPTRRYAGGIGASISVSALNPQPLPSASCRAASA